LRFLKYKVSFRRKPESMGDAPLAVFDEPHMDPGFRRGDNFI